MLQSTIATNSTSGGISLTRDLNFALIRAYPFVVERADGDIFGAIINTTISKKDHYFHFPSLASSSTYFVNTTATTTYHHHHQQLLAMPVISPPSTTTNGKLHAHLLS